MARQLKRSLALVVALLRPLRGPLSASARPVQRVAPGQVRLSRSRQGLRALRAPLTTRRDAPGFSLVELLMATVIFFLVAIGSLLLLAVTNDQSNQTQSQQEQQFAVSIDLARIQAINDRYTCATGTCVIDDVGSPPGQSEYYPSSSANQTTFNTLCSNGNLIDTLITLIAAEPIPAQMQSMGISRSAVKETVTSPPSHRYTVTWSLGGTRIRQVTLVPTTAAWCP